MAATLKIENGTIITLGAHLRVLESHSVLIEDGIVRRITPSGELKDRAQKTIDARGSVVLPGFINAHTHFYSTLARGLGKVAPANDFAGILKNLWWKLDRALTLDDAYLSATISCINAIRHGTTTLIDHHASPSAVRGSLESIAGAVSDTGLRACLCYEVSDRDGAGVAKEGLEENAAFIRRCRDRKDDRLKALFGLHASFTLTDLTLSAAAALGGDLQSGFHIHVAEGEADQRFAQDHFGMRVVERLQRFGILGERTIAAHCVHVSGREMELLADTGTKVVHNPQSNLNNAVGIADLLAMQQKGIAVGLGTDAMTADMLEELRVAIWCQHLRRESPSAGFGEVTATLFRHNAVIARGIWDLPLGEISEGAPADVILVNYLPPTPLNEETALGHLVYGVSQEPVDTTVVGGRVLMERGVLALGIDEERLTARAREAASKIWERFGNSPAKS